MPVILENLISLPRWALVFETALFLISAGNPIVSSAILSKYTRVNATDERNL